MALEAEAISAQFFGTLIQFHEKSVGEWGRLPEMAVQVLIQFPKKEVLVQAQFRSSTN